MSPTRLIDLAFLVVFVLIGIRLVPGAFHMLRVYLTIGSRRLEDATAFAPAEPAEVYELTSRLMALGFRRIGVRSAVLPGEGRRFEWNLVDEPTTTYISLVPVAGKHRLITACYSAFADGAFLETVYPSGATVRRPDLDARAAGRTPEESISFHHQHLPEFAADHGPPLVNATMADLLARDDTYRRRHGGATIRRGVYTLAALAALVIATIAFLLVRIVFFDA